NNGALDARVPMPKRHDDVAELVQFFNTVLDKNASLIRAMREALDNVAHDLRTPLTSLRGTAELALRQNDPNVAREALGDCVERADEVLRLLRALMEISEAEAGMLPLDKAPCDLTELARSAVELYSYVAEASQLTLVMEGSERVPVVADATRIRQAIANLIDNAVKYTPPGGRIVVKTTVQDKEAVLEVRDTGPGVPPPEQTRIWDRLYRGDQSRSKSGLGLGLSLVRVIALAHDGRATVRNGETGGAIFELRFPLASTPVPEPAVV
ncbi:MAG TPA: HAMP domain-containing sensor histidine kinase, partial [Opitutaceae bacterium]|nr:HAMP domain-containing sensor histidine kinase [Opitutaceae bacterium]